MLKIMLIFVLVFNVVYVKGGDNGEETTASSSSSSAATVTTTSTTISTTRKPDIIRTTTKRVRVYTYPVLFRDYVYTSLSKMGEEKYSASGIHPSCVEKKGSCIPRASCVNMEMLYISRVCYKWNLVCCYDANDEMRLLN